MELGQARRRSDGLNMGPKSDVVQSVSVSHLSLEVDLRKLLLACEWKTFMPQMRSPLQAYGNSDHSPSSKARKSNRFIASPKSPEARLWKPEILLS